MKYRQSQLNPIPIYDDPQATNIGLSYLYSETHEQAQFVERIKQEFRRHAADTIRSHLPGISLATGLSDSEILDALKNYQENYFKIQDEPFDPSATVHDRIASLFPDYGIDTDQGVFTLHRRFDPLSADDSRFHRFIKKLKLKRPMTEEERLPAVIRSFEALQNYIEITRTTGVPHSMDERRIVYVGVPSVENFPMHERVYRRVADFYGQNGAFEMEVLPANPQGKESPPLLSARYKKDQSQVSEH